MQKVKQVPIEEASLQQLRAFANNNLGLELAPNCKTDTVLAKIRSAWNQPYVLVPDDDPPVSIEPAQLAPTTAAAPTPAPQRGAGAPPPVLDRPELGKVRIKITREDGPGGADPVPLGVNGKIMVVERDKLSDIPYPYFEALSHAIRKVYEPNQDGNGYNPDPRLVPQYHHNVDSTADEIAAARDHWAEIDRKAAQAA